MKATREGRNTLVDLLDRVLDKGAVIDADVIITVAGVPLLGLKLRAMLASVDTMIQYGMWVDWDKAIRAAAAQEARQKQVQEDALLQGETVRYQCFSSYWQPEGIVKGWTYGTLSITDTAIRLHRKEPAATLLACRFEDLRGYSLESGPVSSAEPSAYLHLVLTDGSISTLHPKDIRAVLSYVGFEMEKRMLPWQPVEYHAGLAAGYRKYIAGETRAIKKRCDI
ncbi:MAG: gas vesicle protein [Methanoregula sp.]|nr:gas vesicle protein [Methanoregula sp.]